MIFLDCSKDEKWCTFNADKTFTFRGFDDGCNLFRNGIEWIEFNDLVLAESVLGTGVMTKRFQESFIDGIETFGFSGGSETSRKHEIFGIDAFDSVGFVKRKLVLR